MPDSPRDISATSTTKEEIRVQLKVQIILDWELVPVSTKCHRHTGYTDSDLRKYPETLCQAIPIVIYPKKEEKGKNRG